jgi:hypothetical protein
VRSVGAVCEECDLVVEPAAGSAIVWTNHWPDRVGTSLAYHSVALIQSGQRISLVNWSSTAIPLSR